MAGRVLFVLIQKAHNKMLEEIQWEVALTHSIAGRDKFSLLIHTDNRGPAARSSPCRSLVIYLFCRSFVIELDINWDELLLLNSAS